MARPDVSGQFLHMNVCFSRYLLNKPLKQTAPHKQVVWLLNMGFYGRCFLTFSIAILVMHIYEKFRTFLQGKDQ